MTYHVNITQFLFAHTISEVLDGAAFVALFVGAVQQATGKELLKMGRRAEVTS